MRGFTFSSSLAAGENGLKALQRPGRRYCLGHPPHILIEIGMRALHRRSGLYEQHIPVERRQIDQRSVQGITLRRTGGPASAGGARGHGTAPTAPRATAVAPFPVPPAPSAICSASISPASRSADNAASLSLRRADQMVSSLQTCPERRERSRNGQYRGAPSARVRIPGEPLRPPDVTPAGLCRPRCVSRVDTGVAQYASDGIGRRRAQRDVPASDWMVTVTSSGCVDGAHSRERCPRRRLLEDLQQRVGRRLR